MTVQSGTRIGIYEVAEVIGAGGMGEVYRATDTTLERDVAIKFLPESFASDANRVARFEQEAKVLASLNHPNIAQVFGLERSGETTAIVMELVDGPTLADRIAQGPIPADEALEIAMQIANALEAAHDKGIVHRDLKPANVKLRRDGTVKVLDFGIAKAFDPSALTSGPQTPVMTTPVTQIGLILGTAAYMSPEQARGRPVDQRTDIWAFGCVLFEMLTGQPVFAGEDVSITLARVLERDTNLDSMPARVSPFVRQTIALCLRKDPRKRLHSIGDVRLALEGELTLAGVAATQAAPDSVRAPIWRRALPVVAALAVGGAVVGAVAWTLVPDELAQPITRFSEPMLPVTNLPGLAISDDGTQIVYTEGNPPRTLVRRLEEFAPRPFPEASIGVASGATTTMLCISPDGEWLAHTAANGSQLRKSPLSGGRGLALTELPGIVYGNCDWAPDGFIYIGTQMGLARVAESGGAAEMLLPNDAGRISFHASPQVLPGGDQVLYTIVEGDVLGPMSTAVLDLATRESEVLLPTAGLTIFAPTGPDPRTGFLVFGQDAALFAAPFDTASHAVGSIRPVIDQIYGIAGVSIAAVSQTGTLAYVDGLLIAGNSSLSWVDRSGRIQSSIQTPRLWGEATLSPDGTRAAGGMVELGTEVKADIYTLDLASERSVRTSFAGFNGSIVWTPDSARVIYASFNNVTQTSGAIESVAIDNSGQPTRVAEFEALQAYPTSISPDGRVLIGTAFSAKSVGADVFALNLEDRASRDEPAKDDDVEFIVQTNFATAHAAFSPDGRWIAYESDESGNNQIYVIPYPGPGGKSQISVDGGVQPQWSPKGDELFFLSGSRMMVADVQTEPGFRSGTPRALFESATLLSDGPTNGNGFQYAVAPNGEQFLMLSTGVNADQQQLRVVENWFEELRRDAAR